MRDPTTNGAPQKNSIKTIKVPLVGEQSRTITMSTLFLVCFLKILNGKPFKTSSLMNSTRSIVGVKPMPISKNININGIT
jgi:hypothetical protein